MAAALAVLIACLLAFDRAASAGLDRLSRWLDRESQLRERLAALPDKAAYKVLVLGTSRTYESIHPAAIERELGVKAYKEASKGKGLRYSYEFYRLYREIVGKPKVLVYGIDYFIFGLPSEDAVMRQFDTAPQRRTSPHAVPLETLAHKAENDRVIVRILERVQRRFFAAEFDPEHNQADMAAYTGPAVSRVIPRPEPARYHRVEYARFPSLEGEFLVKLLQACAADGVRVMFVYPPDYEATRRTNFEHEAFVSDFRRLIAGTPNTFFFDYDDPARFPVADAALFWDGDWGSSNSHLSRRGAEVFGRLYIPDLRRVLSSQ